MGLMQSGSNLTDRIVKYVATRAERKTKPASPPMGHVNRPGCGFLIVRDQKDEEPDHSPPGILGMNIAQRCKQLILAEFDSALAGALDSDWRDAFSMVHGEALTGANSTVRIAGRYRTRVSAASVATVLGPHL